MDEFNNFTDKTAWIIVEPGLRGTENQCIALAEHLQIGKTVTKYVEMKKPWVHIAPYLFRFQEKAYLNPRVLFKPPFPDIIIASGRKSVNAALHIKKLSGDQAFLIQIQNPRLPPKKFDVVVAPKHDDISADNVITSLGALNRITPDFLKENLNKNYTHLDKLKAPKVAVLIGGATTKTEFTVKDAEELAEYLKALKKDGASLMITTSRRTGKVQTALLKRELHDENTEFWDGAGSNPYFDYLHHADAIIVTNDSVSMATEAIATGKPVMIADIGTQGHRIETFHRYLQENNWTKPFTGALQDWKRPVYDDMLKISQEIATCYERFLKDGPDDTNPPQ